MRRVRNKRLKRDIVTYMKHEMENVLKEEQDSD